MVAQSPIGETVPVEVLLDGKLLTLHVEISELHPVSSAQNLNILPPNGALRS